MWHSVVLCLCHHQSRTVCDITSSCRSWWRVNSFCWSWCHWVCLCHQVFESVMQWVRRELVTRQQFVSELVEHVRLPLLSQEFLVQRVEEEQLIKSNSECKDYLIEAMKYHLLRPQQKLVYKTPRTKPRTPLGLPKVRLPVHPVGEKYTWDVSVS